MTLRYGLIGSGMMGQEHIRNLNLLGGCEVTAISTSPGKEEETRELGAHHFLNARDESALTDAGGAFDFILSTVNVKLDWEAYINMLRPKGKLHLVGAAPEVSSEVFPLIMAQRSISASPVGSPATIATMLDFCARHGIAPHTREFAMSEINEALEILENESPAKRLVLKN